MIALVLTPQFPTPPKPASHWRLLLATSRSAATALIWPRKNTDLVRYRRASRTLTAEERRRVYLLQAGKLDLYRAEFGEPPAVVPAGGAV